MDIENKNVWQIAAGDGYRNYSGKCLAENVIVIGPGHYGAWPDCENDMRKDGVSGRRIGIVRRFAEEMKPGDIVVLRVGTQKVYGVGEIVSNYDWSEAYRMWRAGICSIPGECDGCGIRMANQKCFLFTP